jgi:hypothetical protein
MKFKIYSFLFLLILTPYVLAETYIATQHEMKMADSSYIKSLHHIKIGKTVVISEFRAFGELGFGEDLNNGTAFGSGLSYEYLRAGFSKKIFNNIDIKVHFESKLNNHSKDDNELQINTKYTF